MTPKAWGYTELIAGNNVFEVHRIEVKAGGYCSMHKHAYKHNMIRVEKGALTVVMPDVETDKICIVKSGESITIPPGESHRFSAIEDTIAYELYWIVNISEFDITRLDAGGINDPVMDS